MILFRRGNYYYETHYTYWALKKLVAKFEVFDYTKKIIEFPEEFSATNMIAPGTLKQKIYLFVLNVAYWVCPTYIWLLKKKE